ncbi:hypothetical protein BKA81DRAFT_348347 [Phyllosticta paracitricarpa]
MLRPGGILYGLCVWWQVGPGSENYWLAAIGSPQWTEQIGGKPHCTLHMLNTVSKGHSSSRASVKTSVIRRSVALFWRLRFVWFLG